MLLQLLIGTVAIIFIVIINAELFELFSNNFYHLKHSVKPLSKKLSRSVITVCAVLWIIFSMTVQVWIWAIVLLATGALSNLEPAVYFATVCFTTLGFGDVILTKEWRLLSAIIAANGLVMFSWSAAFLFDVLQKVKKS